MMDEVKKTGSKKSKVAELESQRDDFKEKWIRTLAEFENFKKRTQKEKDVFFKYANEKIVLEICDVFDNFERALQTDETNMTDETDSFSTSFIKGMKLIYQQLQSVLSKNDVIKLECQGKEFDPNFHEALAAIPSMEPQNTIVAIIQNGYMMKDKVIRHCRVAVSNGEKPE